MKNLINIIILLLALVIVSCAELDTYPEGATITSEQKESVVADDPTLLSTDVEGLNGVMIYCGVDASSVHSDFGFPAICLMYDSNAADMPCPVAGYNWFANFCTFTSHLHTNWYNGFIWRTFYKYIYGANGIITAVPDAGEDPILCLYKGYALAARAFGYFNLVQCYQYNYQANADVKAVPIVTESTTPDEIANNPRATVKEVYDMIMEDLDAAIELLKDAQARPGKGYIDLSVAYGIRARVNLVMGNYAQAASDAATARASYQLLTLADVSLPGFNSASVKSCMWASIVSESNRAVTSGIINWPSHLCSFASNSYTGAGGWKMINNQLWETIPGTDVRKGWWVDENLKSPVLDLLGGGSGEERGFVAYNNVKFHAYQSIDGNSLNASDWINMRAEEMLLIEAEGLAMSGNLSGGKQLLETWVKQNRNPSFVSTASSAEAFQLEVWHQRRIELWAEGFAWFDLMRLGKPMVRFSAGRYDNPEEGPINSNWLESQRFNVAANNDIRLFRIPEAEIDANSAIDISENPTGGVPVPKEGDGLSDGIL